MEEEENPPIGHAPYRLHFADFTIASTTAALIPGSQIPLHICEDADQPGRRFWFEQRSWLWAAPCDMTNIAKRQFVAGKFGQQVARYGCVPNDYGKPVPASPGGRSPFLLSTRGVLSWMQHRSMAARYNSNDVLRDFFNQAVTNFFNVASSGITILDRLRAQLPKISVSGRELMFTKSGGVNLTPLKELWPTMPSDWATLREVEGEADTLGKFAPVVPLRSLFRVLDHRLRGTAALPDGFWMTRLFHAVVEVSAFLVEVDVGTAVLEHFPTGAMVVLGAKRMRRAPCQLNGRMHLLKRLGECTGSSATITLALCGQKGVAVAVVAARQWLYDVETRAKFESATAVALHWDASTHSGMDVTLGVAIKQVANCAAFLRPMASL